MLQEAALHPVDHVAVGVIEHARAVPLRLLLLRRYRLFRVLLGGRSNASDGCDRLLFAELLQSGQAVLGET